MREGGSRTIANSILALDAEETIYRAGGLFVRSFFFFFFSSVHTMGLKKNGHKETSRLLLGRP